MLQATSALLASTTGVTLDFQGGFYVTSQSACTIRYVNSIGIINRVAGTQGTCAFLGDGVAATAAQLNKPFALLLDGTGVLGAPFS